MPKVAIIGGGPAALAAAFELTAGRRRRQYQVTIYQPGWRLGGKCASGRNAERYDRIEEHGLHVWFGSYGNAFGLLERCYDELRLSRRRYAFTSVDEVFQPLDVVALWQHRHGEWTPKVCEFPRNRRGPVNFLDFAVEGFGWAQGELLRHHARRDVAPPAAAEAIFEGLGLGQVETWEARIGHGVSRLQRQAARLLADVTATGVGDLVDVADELLRLAEAVLPPELGRDPDVVFFTDTLDLFAAVLRGVWREELLVRGFDAANDRDLAAWLAQHGASLAADPIDWPALLRATYDGCFAFEGGDPQRPRIAAGRALQGAVRCLLHYDRGSVLYRARTSMAEATVSPLFLALRRRGVQFRFFHAAAALEPSPDGDGVGSIRMVEQVPGWEGYDPLVDVPYGGRGGPVVPAWPSLPKLGGLPGPAERLESEIDPFGGTERTLTRGRDFDEVVLAVPPDVQREICAPLAAADPAYAGMLAGSRSVVTQACQFWMTRTAMQLRQRFSSDSLMSCYVEPLDTYLDMSQLLPGERWPAAVGVRHVAYLCGVLAVGRDGERAADRAVRDSVATYLAEHASRIWTAFAPDAPRPVEPGSVLARPHDAPAGENPLDFQYLRANTAASERYVLTLPGSVESRLAARGTRFDNLVLAGDWTISGFDVSCVEAAMTSGRLAAAAICGSPRPEEIVGLNGPPGFPSRGTGADAHDDPLRRLLDAFGHVARLPWEVERWLRDRL